MRMGSFIGTVVTVAAFLTLSAPGTARAAGEDLIAAGDTAMEACEFSTAVGLFSDAIAALPAGDANLAMAHVYRGLAHEWLGDLGAALADHNAALVLDANFLDALEMRIYVYDKLGEADKADADMAAYGPLALAQDRELDRRRVVIERAGNPPVRLNFLGQSAYGYRSKLADC